MATADPNGNVTLFVVSQHPTDPTSIRTDTFMFPATASIKGAASAVATAMGLSTASLTLVGHQPFGTIPPALEVATVTLASSILVNGAHVVLQPGT